MNKTTTNNEVEVNVSFTVVLPKSWANELNELAEASRISKAALVRFAIRELLNNVSVIDDE